MYACLSSCVENGICCCLTGTDFDLARARCMAVDRLLELHRQEALPECRTGGAECPFSL